MLISAIMPIMSIYNLPHGQYRYSGHVVNLPQDVLSFATSLPSLPSEIDVLKTDWTHNFTLLTIFTDDKQLHISTCNGCENLELVIACNYAARSGSPHLCNAHY